MRNVVYIGGSAVGLTSNDVIGQGGEAVVYRYGTDALKVLLTPDDPAYAGDPAAQHGAVQRAQEYQDKLPAFPHGLPSGVIVPKAFAFEQMSSRSDIVGYTMSLLNDMEVLLRYGDRQFRSQAGIDHNAVVQLFQRLHKLVRDVHARGVVIGDFNDLNVMVSSTHDPYLIDADSMQFGVFPCRTFTTRFVDPAHCRQDRLELARPHSDTSDWYAFAVMLFQSLLFLNPYGGVHKPKQGKRLRESARVLERVTVFSPDVIYPKAALHFSTLPDELAGYFANLFGGSLRGEFPEALLAQLRWTTCSSCGLSHARPQCPGCSTPGVVKETTMVRGKVTAKRLFRTSGKILTATVQEGRLRYVYHESGAYFREDAKNILRSELHRDVRLRIWGEKTVFARRGALVVLEPDNERQNFQTQMVGRLPVFAVNGRHLYRLQGDYLLRDDTLGDVTIGGILRDRTLIWAGDRFGLGFFRAGSLTRTFVFDAERTGINDTVPVPPMAGTLVDATCAFSNDMVWFMIAIQESNDLKHHCFVISRSGELLAHASAIQGDGTWLGDGIRGRLAIGNRLYAATDSGIVHIECQGKNLAEVRSFPDTEPFVSTDSQLFPSKEGIIVVSQQEIFLLQIR